MMASHTQCHGSSNNYSFYSQTSKIWPKEKLRCKITIVKLVCIYWRPFSSSDDGYMKIILWRLREVIHDFVFTLFTHCECCAHISDTLACIVVLIIFTRVSGFRRFVITIIATSYNCLNIFAKCLYHF